MDPARQKKFPQFVKKPFSLCKAVAKRIRFLKNLLYQSIELNHAVEERTRTLESLLYQSIELNNVVEERTRTLEFLTTQMINVENYNRVFLHQWYTELMEPLLGENLNPLLAAPKRVGLLSDFPLAKTSLDCINPESTVEGIVRPTHFVRNCIDLFGQDFNLLDLGTGAGGLIFECLANGIFSVGIDGSDYCARYRIGYWPLLKNNLFNCDITKQFSFVKIEEQDIFTFQIITMWEVLEHIDDENLDSLFNNVYVNLSDNGYFIGSVSLIPYADKDGNPW